MHESPITSTFAKRLIALRGARNLNQVECAEQTGIGKSTISRLESGEGEPTLSTIRRIAEFFGCSADYLVGLSDHRDRLPANEWLIDLDFYESAKAGHPILDPDKNALGAPIPSRPKIVDSNTYHRMIGEVREWHAQSQRKRRGK